MAERHAQAVRFQVLLGTRPRRTRRPGLRFAAEAPDNLASLRGFFERKPIAITSELLTRISADGPGVNRSEIAQIRVPTLVIGCGRDLVHPLSLARALAAMMPTARLAEITPKAESRELYRSDFRGAVAAFLADVPR